MVKWGRNTFRAERIEFETKTKALKVLRLDNHDRKNDELIRDLNSEINAHLHKEEIHWRQRSRVVWIQAGDKNTKYFHFRATQRQRKNRIHGLFDSKNIWQEEASSVAHTTEQYFKDIFSTSHPPQIDHTIDSMEAVVTQEHNSTLLLKFKAKEVRKAVFQMPPSTSPGPDGMSCFFFQKFWHIIGDLVVKAMLAFLNSGHMLKKINYTHIALIPKIKNPQRVFDFRLISLCNVIYKIISKVLVNRLQRILPQIISDSQSAFLSGRLITDNVAVAYELMHTMRSKWKGKVGYLAMKLDMSKTYDRVEWAFLKAAMLKMGFAQHWVDLVMECVSTPTYSILINGVPQGYIHPSRGVRQGDPLSSFIFLICAEGLSSLI